MRHSFHILEAENCGAKLVGNFQRPQNKLEAKVGRASSASCPRDCTGPPEGMEFSVPLKSNFIYVHTHAHSLKHYSVQKSPESGKVPKSTPINTWHHKFSNYTLRCRHVDFQSANVKYGKYTQFSEANQIQALHYAFRFYLRPLKSSGCFKKLSLESKNNIYRIFHWTLQNIQKCLHVCIVLAQSQEYDLFAILGFLPSSVNLGS